MPIHLAEAIDKTGFSYLEPPTHGSFRDSAFKTPRYFYGFRWSCVLGSMMIYLITRVILIAIHLVEDCERTGSFRLDQPIYSDKKLPSFRDLFVLIDLSTVFSRASSRPTPITPFLFKGCR